MANSGVEFSTDDDAIMVLHDTKGQFVCKIVQLADSLAVVESESNPKRIEFRDDWVVCLQCNCICKNNFELENHISMEHYPSKQALIDFLCDQCNFKFATVTQLVLHKRLHLPYSCLMCPRVFKTLYQLREHIARYHADNYWKAQKLESGCPICSETDFLGKTLLQHMAGHINVASFKCRICLQMYGEKKEFWRHIASQHAVLMPKVMAEKTCCGTCGQQFRTTSALKAHLNSYITNGALYCDACQRPFHNLMALEKHVASEHPHGARPSWESDQLQSNIVRNTNVPMKMCWFCSRFMLSTKFLEHTKSHLLLYYCEACDASFSGAYNLCRHRENFHPDVRAPFTDEMTEKDGEYKQKVLDVMSRFVAKAPGDD